MKAKIILLTIAIISSSVVFSQQVKHENKTDCDKKVLNKIKRHLNYLNVKDYLAEGEKTSVIVTCFINEDQEVEIAKINGSDRELVSAISKTLKKHPVKCKNEPSGNYFTFKITFDHRPA